MVINKILYPDKIEYRNEKGQLHNEDEPAIEFANGCKHWYINGKRHRIGGPASIYSYGAEEWYCHGKLHRLDGPAVIGDNTIGEWYYHGQHIDCTSQKEFERLIKLLAFL